MVGRWTVRDGTLNHSSLLMFCAHTLTHATSAHFLRAISQLCFPRDLQKEIILFVDDFNILCAAFFTLSLHFLKKLHNYVIPMKVARLISTHFI